MDIFLRRLLEQVDMLLRTDVTVHFVDDIIGSDLSLVEACDDEIVESLGKTPLSSSEKVDLITKAINFLTVSDLIRYNELPLTQRAKVDIEKIEQSYKFLEASLKAYFNDSSSHVPLTVSLQKLESLKANRERVKHDRK